MEPKISVITITFNSEATLEETILSVTTQDYPALEYVIIDGGSTDGTLDIIRKYQNKIQVVVSELVLELQASLEEEAQASLVESLQDSLQDSPQPSAHPSARF